MDVENATDVKVYTIGPTFAHAETRKSPVVDGIVQRNQEGKEIRYITQLTTEEKKYSKNVCMAFRQMICGFDLLRAGGSSFVIDVNGWSFVKGNTDYYDQCASMLRKMFIDTAKKQRRSKSLMLTKDVSFENQWRMKGYFSVIRHGDRTPKLKKKFSFLSAPFQSLLCGGKDEVIFKGEAVGLVAKAANEALDTRSEDAEKLHLLLNLLEQKQGKTDTKVQVKPSWNKSDGGLDKLQVIVKWGGEFTHAGEFHSLDLGENLRKDLLLINKELLSDVVVYSASERRVIQTAEVFTKSFLGGEPTEIIIRKEMLDDSNAAKEQMERVKKQLQDYNCIKIPGIDDAAGFIADLMRTMSELREIMRRNYESFNVNDLQATWCCNETPALFRERWEKLFREFCDGKSLDPSKVSDLYDSLKFDALHNREFVTHIFSHQDEVWNIELESPLNRQQRARSFSYLDQLKTHGIPLSPLELAIVDNDANSSQTSFASIVSGNNPTLGNSVVEEPVDRYPGVLRSLFRKTKLVFDVIAPAEYGLDAKDKLEIGLLTSQPLLRQIVQDLEAAKVRPSGACTRLYFTKESHVHTLLNIVFQSGLSTKMQSTDLDEMDYLTQITFELYERNRGIANEGEKEFSVRCSFSPGAFCAELVDLKIGHNHAISASAPKRDLTEHLSLDEVVGRFSTLLDEVLPAH
jgi:hypothetical protein